MESERKDAKPVLTNRFVINLHVIVESFLITQVIIILHVIVGYYTVRRFFLIF